MDEEKGIEDGSVKRNKTVGERSAAHLVRHLVSAQSVIIVTAEAGLYNNREVWKERQNSSSFHSGQTNMLAGVMTGNKYCKLEGGQGGGKGDGCRGLETILGARGNQNT